MVNCTYPWLFPFTVAPKHDLVYLEHYGQGRFCEIPVDVIFVS